MDKRLKEIETIQTKLFQGIKLTDNEINWIISALRLTTHNMQESYYELVYHDEFDRKEHRIINPFASKIREEGDAIYETDCFEVTFTRLKRRCNNDQ